MLRKLADIVAMAKKNEDDSCSVVKSVRVPLKGLDRRSPITAESRVAAGFVNSEGQAVTMDLRVEIKIDAKWAILLGFPSYDGYDGYDDYDYYSGGQQGQPISNKISNKIFHNAPIRCDVRCVALSPKEAVVTLGTATVELEIVDKWTKRELFLGRRRPNGPDHGQGRTTVATESVPVVLAQSSGYQLQVNNNTTYAESEVPTINVCVSLTFKGLTFSKPILAEYRRTNSIASSVEDVVVSLQAAKDNPDLHDFQLYCGGKVLPCNKFILAARSEVFRAMLAHKNVKEVQEGRIDVEDAEPEELEVFLQLLYTGQSNCLDKHARNVYKLADKYQIPSIKKLCLTSLEANLNVENAAAAAILAHIYEEEDFETKVLTFIKDNLKTVRKAPDWKTIEKKHSEIVTKLLVLKMEEDDKK